MKKTISEKSENVLSGFMLKYTKKLYFLYLILIFFYSMLFTVSCSSAKRKKQQSIRHYPLQITILNDERCKSCAISVMRLNVQIKIFFPDAKFRELDFSSKEAKKILKNNHIKYLPAFIFPLTVKQMPIYKKLKQFFDPAGSYLALRIGAHFDPYSEICDNKIDDTGNGLIDCDDPDCKEKFVCRKEQKRVVELFVMSHCPFGQKALHSLTFVKKAFEKDNLEINIHYIANKIDKGITSLHGNEEVMEDMTQLCIQNLVPDRFFSYIFCITKKEHPESSSNCMKKLKISDKINECIKSDQGKKMLLNDIKIVQQLKIKASPTWIVNKIYQFSALSPGQIQQNICKHNPKLYGCKKKLKMESDIEGKCRE